MESMPYFAFISGLTKRQPIVVSSIFALRARRRCRPSRSTKGARDMLSTPPAITSDISPALIARAAIAIASMLDPHRRLTVVPGTSTGKPASSSAMRADVAVVLARLIGAAVDDVVDRMSSRRRDCAPSARAAGIAARSSVRTRGERAAVAADRRANRVAEEGVRHEIWVRARWRRRPGGGASSVHRAPRVAASAIVDRLARRGRQRATGRADQSRHLKNVR